MRIRGGAEANGSREESMGGGGGGGNVCKGRFSVEVDAGDIYFCCKVAKDCRGGLFWWTAERRGGYGRYGLHEPCHQIDSYYKESKMSCFSALHSAGLLMTNAIIHRCSNHSIFTKRKNHRLRIFQGRYYEVLATRSSTHATVC